MHHNADNNHNLKLATADEGSPPGLRLGELLVRQGTLTPQQLSHALDVQAATSRPLGDLCERLFGIAPAAVSRAWAEQHVALHGEQDLSLDAADGTCIDLLEARQAWQFRLVPLRRDLDADGIGHLVVAAGRRDLNKSMTFACRALPLAPAIVIATPDSLRALLTEHYPVSPHLANWAFGR